MIDYFLDFLGFCIVRLKMKAKAMIISRFLPNPETISSGKAVANP